ncbi:hypothetical protein PAXINDRAFT_84251 [Paxillus involutus ATCC 200175]|uniref:Uncharacterized protein n=1 Tax=Paxillus involutus ATCC 200175 TaxID=664439 RepID=A0A0C9TLX5_PAXIN|nr:hypothetical protein PAXINDRAFT_84251 [Paxillus involutus ATCC 200175]
MTSAASRTPILQSFHVQVLHVGPLARSHSKQTMDVLWVHWLGTESWGFKEARLPKVGFSDGGTFGFLDPLPCRDCHSAI